MKEVRISSSQLCKNVYNIVKEVWPEEKIIQEQTIKINGKNLFLDIYLPRLKIAFECNGEQHYNFNKFFHSDIMAFKQQKQNDELKKLFCKESSINLIEIKYNDKIDKDFIEDKVLESLKGE